MFYRNRSSVQAALTIAFISVTGTALAQSDETGESVIHQSAPQSFAPLPDTKPDPNLPPRTIQRTSTAISGARNSISIKSTDAGIIHYPPAVLPPNTPPPSQPPALSGCINCGVIDFINIAHGNAPNVITSGIIAGTIARKIGEHGAHQHTDNTPGRHAHPGQQHQQHYHVGVTMQDGNRQIIMVPDITGLHRGDFVQIKDGVLTPETGGY
ncbi:hypothetical protein [Nitrosomonas sp.]|uniref:hypothetical protein n=1 Tax=Nitrosomonas sp. TaxID=42353 RepID=UPI00284524F0|nr:hypothetical protein [Nitrosomonas sp.]MDR4514728.1 hypothetical protein [Nitrosomonas sp.]